jgi:F0F1-type ATP synthase assembly protein I
MAKPPLDEEGRSQLSTVQSLAVASQFGVTLAVSVVLGYLAGQWLDGRLNTGIIFTLIGVFLGLAAAATSTVRLFQATLRKSAQQRARTAPRDNGVSASHQADEGTSEE